MKELVVLLIAVLIASFIVSLPSFDGDWYLYRGEARMWELAAEADTLRARSLIFARAFVDTWLARMNGTPCEIQPPSPNGSLFKEELMEDLRAKGFSLAGSIGYSVGESMAVGRSDPAFGGACRDGGVEVSVISHLEVRDALLGMVAHRSFRAKGCQPTSYYLMRRVLSELESGSLSVVKDSFSAGGNLTESMEMVREGISHLVGAIRENLTGKGLDVWASYSTKFLGDRLIISFRAVVTDGEAVIIYGGKERRGFTCSRDWEVSVELP